jgi:hypothetical protein
MKCVGKVLIYHPPKYECSTMTWQIGIAAACHECCVELVFTLLKIEVELPDYSVEACITSG